MNKSDWGKAATIAAGKAQENDARDEEIKLKIRVVAKEVQSFLDSEEGAIAARLLNDSRQEVSFENPRVAGSTCSIVAESRLHGPKWGYRLCECAEFCRLFESCFGFRGGTMPDSEPLVWWLVRICNMQPDDILPAIKIKIDKIAGDVLALSKSETKEPAKITSETFRQKFSRWWHGLLGHKEDD